MYERIGPRVGLMCVSRKAAIGRQLPLRLGLFLLVQCPLSVRPDIQAGPMSALRSEPDIRLKWVERPAYDPKRLLRVKYIS